MLSLSPVGVMRIEGRVRWRADVLVVVNKPPVCLCMHLCHSGIAKASLIPALVSAVLRRTVVCHVQPVGCVSLKQTSRQPHYYKYNRNKTGDSVISRTTVCVYIRLGEWSLTDIPAGTGDGRLRLYEHL